ncbi:hypothetical protein [Plantactinospora soyae]|uniref:Uncharacterized protein n=1 Tax=Plantactinospora soyae TaxID=1544732 RepID=A0A927MCS1_9ACTN|nr:hypothetical protein [Plantactinospora soyae]MBE1490746.1 hypothetical protein [Plantactinospora soyae]
MSAPYTRLRSTGVRLLTAGRAGEHGPEEGGDPRGQLRVTYSGLVTVAAGRVSSVPLLRWFTIIGALFAVALFSGSSCGDGPLAPASMAGHSACPNVVLQASLAGALAMETGHGGAPDDRPGPGETVTGACLFVVVALAGLALAGAVRRPLVAHAAYWWVRVGVPLVRPPSIGSEWLGVLRI